MTYSPIIFLKTILLQKKITLKKMGKLEIVNSDFQLISFAFNQL